VKTGDRTGTGTYTLPGYHYVCEMQKNEDGRVGLLSGFSPAICDMVFSQETSPYKILLEKLNSARYDAVTEHLKM
jgi:hypothetical protein